MMKKRIDADAAAETLRLKQEKEQKENDDFCRLVISQAHDSVVLPLQQLFEEFNSQYASGQIQSSLSQTDSSLSLFIDLPSGARGKIEFRALLPLQFFKVRKFVEYDEYHTERVLVMPKLNGRIVQGFGVAQLSDGPGFNIVLVERTGDLYGEWFILLNSSNPIARVQRKSLF